MKSKQHHEGAITEAQVFEIMEWAASLPRPDFIDIPPNIADYLSDAIDRVKAEMRHQNGLMWRIPRR